MLCGVLLIGVSTQVSAYSVLAHEAMVDAAWERFIVPTLRARFPRAAGQQINEARAYAYGGSLIQDLGYYPYGSRFFSNLVHYVESGDFVESLVANAADVNEYAFALGALAHYTSDTAGHSLAVNRAVPILYPKLESKYGDTVIYVQGRSQHVMVEFAFDVVETARGSFGSDVVEQFVGFHVAVPLLERAFRETYGLQLKDVFGDVDLAVGSYRHAVSKLVPDVTRIAWKEKRDEIVAANPSVTEKDVIFSMTRQQYEAAYGTSYRKPGWLARFVVFIFKIVPKFGPFKPLAFKPLTTPTEALLIDSFTASQVRYRSALRSARLGRLAIDNVDLDTGRRGDHGSNRLADETYVDLLKKLDKQKFAGVPPNLKRSINAYFADAASPAREGSGHSKKTDQKLIRLMHALNGAREN
jgi:hypothetical protein